MKILIANTRNPFVFGGAEILEQELTQKLIESGHEVDKFIIPFDYSTLESIADQIAFVRNVEVPNTDLVIGMRFPAYMVRHKNKVTWLVHQYRQIYDLLGSGNSPYDTSDETSKRIEAIKQLDKTSLGESQKIYTISDLVTKRLQNYTGLAGVTLNLPPRELSLRQDKSTREKYIFLPGRINRMKRQHLFIDAIKFTKFPINLVIAGPSEDDVYLAEMQQNVIMSRLSHRVKFDARFLSEDELSMHAHRSLCIAYAPLAEDAFGYVTIEALQNNRICLTLEDSGEVASLVKKISPNFVCENDPKSIAKKLDWIIDNSDEMLAYENNLRQKITAILPSWKHVIGELTK